MLEPRRLAAIGVAERLAAQLGEPLGQRIGLRMRGQTNVSSNTVLEVVTEGVLTRLLQADPTLDGIGLIIFDEFHERSLHADLGLSLCREVQQALREDLRLLLMSATLDAVKLSEAMGAVEQVSCPGRTYPVELHWLANAKADLPAQVTHAVNKALTEESGDVLVFLPGIAEIDRCARSLEPQLGEGLMLFRLHGRADAKTQRAATAPATTAQRRIILSTSIAETSITIDGIGVVIDAGLERRARTDSSTGAQRLETVNASQASATQRAGRAGRTGPGVCYRLWSEHDHKRRATSWQPEIMRAELSGLLLELGLWGVSDADALPWLDPPPAASMVRASAVLESIGVWRGGRLTEHGKDVAALPVHPRIGHMLIWAAARGQLPLACKLAVLLEDGGPKIKHADIDLLVQQKLSPHQARRVDQLQKRLSNNAQPDAGPGAGVMLAQAYPDWIAQRRGGHDARYVLSCGAGVFISADDPLARTSWLAVVSIGGAANEGRVFIASALDIDALQAWSPELFESKKHLSWDDKQERVVAEQRKVIGQLVVQRKTLTDLNDEEKAQALLDGIRQKGVVCLPWTDECRQWQARVKLMTKLDNDAGHAHAWPVVDDKTLSENLESWLLVWLSGKGSLKAVSQINLLSCLQAMLDYEQSQRLDTMLPLRYAVPSGSAIKLRYAEDEIPVLPVKLQEMFGCTENPSIANGQITLKVELLSPARRPVQLTSDLVNFWQQSYVAVKKELAGRYPKHDWPDDPLTAKPTAYAKPRKKKQN